MEYNNTSYKVGMIVKHKSDPWLMSGKIIKIQGRTITIDFDGTGIKDFDSEMTPLEIVQDKKNKIQGSSDKDNNITFDVDVSYFARPDRTYCLNDLQKSPPPSSPGVYGWYFDELLPYVPKVGCVAIETSGLPVRKWYLLYIGKASDLRFRVYDMHFNNRYWMDKSMSSFRLTLGCLLCKNLGIYLQKHLDFPTKDYTFGQKGDQTLSNWMSKYARVAWVETKDYVELEEKTIITYALPLNTDKNPKPFEPLEHLKKEFMDIARSQKPEKSCFEKAYNEFVEECKNYSSAINNNTAHEKKFEEEAKMVLNESKKVAEKYASDKEKTSHLLYDASQKSKQSIRKELLMCPMDNKDRRIVFEWTKITEGENGHRNTEKFYLPANSRISVRIRRRPWRFLPIVPRSGKFMLMLKDPETGKLQKNVSPDFKGKLSKRERGNYEFSIVIHEAGTYYLYIQWGSLIQELNVEIIAPSE